MKYCNILLLIIIVVALNFALSKCNTEGFTQCVDDPEWVVEDINGNTHDCSNIGETVSCYSYGSTGEGWERCLESCGNCSNTQVTALPQDRTVRFSGDPVEEFGIVLFRDDDRQWVGRGVAGVTDDGDPNTDEDVYSDDIRAYMSSDQSEDIEDIYQRLDSVEDIFNILMGSIPERITGLDCTDDLTQFSGYRTCLPTIVPTDISEESHNYIKKNCKSSDGTDCSIEFPTYTLTCGEVSNVVDTPIPTTGSNPCNDYMLFDKLDSSYSDSSYSDSEDIDETMNDPRNDDILRNYFTLGDVCPKECNSIR